MTTRTLDLENLILTAGAHSPDGAMCVMEAVAYVAGENWTDSPACASPVIAAFCRNWNDTPGAAGEAIRSQLKHYIPRLAGSRGTAEQEEQRSLLALDWLIRICLPTWLRLVPSLVEHADRLMALPEFTLSGTDYAAIGTQAHAAGDAAGAAAGDAAWDAAWDAAGAAAGAAAWAAARDVARDAAWAAAGAAARAAAGAAARDAAGDAAGDAARDAAWDAAGDAAWAAAWAAAWDAAWDAAWAAAWAALQPTVEQLQLSAWNLLERMLAITEQPTAA